MSPFPLFFVIAGLDPAIQTAAPTVAIVRDARVMPAHDVMDRSMLREKGVR